MTDVRLMGCTSTPVGSYLKAFGVLRLVAVQADPDARGRWRNGAFELRSQLDLDDLVGFLTERYVPSPILSPWNGGSGFHPKDVGAGAALRTLDQRTHPRFDALRRGIAACRGALGRLEITDKPEGERKERLVRELRASLDDAALEWLDAAVIVLTGKLAFPPVLGSGGNDGRYEFSGNFLLALARLFDEDGMPALGSRELAAGALRRSSTELERVGASHLARDGSPTSSPTGTGDNLANPWDLVLALEGTLALGASAVRRGAGSLHSQLAAPFTAQASAAGYGSATTAETGRGELWLPLWRGWASFPEIRNLARESRMTVGRSPARNGLDATRAARTLGVASGVSAFQRVAILERAGQSGLSVTAGCLTVREAPAARLLNHFEDWLRRVVRLGADGTAAQRLAARQLEAAAFAFAADPIMSTAQALVLRVAGAEQVLAMSGDRSPAGLRPVSLGPGPAWLKVMDDGSPELRLAASIAALPRTPRQAGVREFLLGTGLDDRGRRTYARSTRGVPAHASGRVRLAQLQARRALQAAPSAASAVAISASVLHRAAAGHLNLDRVVALTEALAAADWRTGGTLGPDTPADPVPALQLLAVAWHGHHVHPALPPPRREWPRLLAADRVEPVLRSAHLALRQGGLVPLVTVSDLCADPPIGDDLLAATIVAPRRRDLDAFADAIALTNKEHVS